MLVSIFLNHEGMEAHAKGYQIQTWHLREQIRQEGDRLREGTDKEPLIWLGDLELLLPTATDCIAPALRKLKTEEERINAEAAEQLMEITQRRNDLLIIGHEVRDV